VRRAALIAASIVAAVTAAPASALTSTLSGTSATVTGSNTVNDVLEITSTTSSGDLRHNHGGDPGFASDADWNSSVTGVQALNGSGTTQVIFSGLTGNDALRVGTATSPADNVHAVIDLSGGGGDDQLNVNNSADTAGREFTWNFQSLVLPESGLTVNNTNTEQIEATLGSGADTIQVTWTSSTIHGAISAGDGADTFSVEDAANSLGMFNAISFLLLGGSGGDSITFTDSGTTTPEEYVLGTASFRRSADPPITLNGLEAATINTGSGSNQVLKSAAFPATLNVGPGDDELLTSDGVADTVNCGAGLDSVIADAGDALVGCESFPRVDTPPATPQPVGQQQPQQQVPTDARPPRVSVRLPKTVTKKKLLRGFFVTLTPDEASAFEIAMLGRARSARLARAGDVVLAEARLPLRSGARRVKLKASRRILGRRKRFTIRLAVTAVDAARNRTVVTRTLKIRR
jgi:hypothetical protein